MRSALLAVSLIAMATTAGCNRERNQSIQLMNKGIAQFNQNDTTGAVVAFNQATTLDPTNDAAYYYRGLLKYQRTTDFAEAAKDFRKAIEINGANHLFHYHLGKVLSRQGEWAAAINALEKAIQLKADHAQSHYQLGRALEQQAKFDRAQDEYVAAIKAQPRFADPYVALGNLYARFEKFPEAVQVFKNGVENNSEKAELRHDLGVVYQNQQRFDDAIEQFNAAVKLKPTYLSALFNLGIAYQQSENREQAIANLKLYLGRRQADEDPHRRGHHRAARSGRAGPRVDPVRQALPAVCAAVIGSTRHRWRGDQHRHGVGVRDCGPRERVL